MIFVFFEKESLGNYKAQLALRGIRTAVAKRKYDCRILHELDEVAPADVVGTPIVVFCTSESRSRRLVEHFWEKQYRPVFIVNRPFGAENTVSGVSIDYRRACYRLTSRMLEDDGDPVAFLGFNSDSVPDKQRMEGFRAAMEEKGAEGRVFSNFGDVRSCLEEYWSHRAIYKNVVCANDIHAVALVNRLKENGEDCGAYRICGFGNTMLSRYSDPPITTVEPNYELAGRCAVELTAVLERNSHVRAVTFTVDAELYEGGRAVEDLGGAILPHAFSAEHGDFYHDDYVMELDNLDSMLSACDEADIGILHGLLSGESHETICETHFIALNTLKYRIKKLVSAAGAEDKNDLIRRIRKYRLNI